ncbi:CerR family C-terminal domain-containing protein [Pseudomonas typographi]|uniref:CerR family C-terminal domain-containing protein n=1 Tax=Pseudomonas typographi TaxID=2715964 RepID=A0ABR7YX25_9PSED|nr:CerR family C-terminal domain-containing protein [Pseudomonas typographi]MBD1551221.1 CerR family C-terminal domain-containing protein [Pseudomonas typographi]MBD1597757.1 CerR family C-terminal domain-containing protein [Pseudomonas typographi]
MARYKPTHEGGYQRGAQTRTRLVEAAVRVFGEKGYDAASTRDIASAAGLNAPALQYYFENKEGVYLACVEHIIERLWEQLGSATAAAEGVLADPGAADARRVDAVLGILSRMIALIDDGSGAKPWREFMSRQQAGQCPASAHALMNERFKPRIAGVIRGLVAHLSGYPVDDERTILHAFGVFTQVAALRVQRQSLLDSLGWDAIGPVRMEKVRDVVLAQVRFALEGLVRLRAGAR